MGLFKALRVVTNDIGGSRWAPATDLPAYAKPKQARQTSQTPSLSSDELMEAHAKVDQLKEELAEALYAVRQAGERCDELYYKAIQCGHTDSTESDAYAAGLPSYLTSGVFSPEMMQLALLRQQVLSLHNAAQVTLAAAKSNAAAKKVVHEQAEKVLRQNLEHVCRERDFYKKESGLLRREHARLYQRVQSAQPRPHTSAGHYSTPSAPSSPPTMRPRQASTHSEHDHKRAEELSPAFALHDMFPQ